MFGNFNCVIQVFFQNFQSPQVTCIVVVFTVSIAFINIVFQLDFFFFFFFFVDQGGSLSSMVNVSWGIKLESIFRIVLFRMNLFINVSIYECFIPVKHSNCSSDKISICILVVPDVTQIRWWLMNFPVKFCKNDLVMRIFTSLKMDGHLIQLSDMVVR